MSSKKLVFPPQLQGKDVTLLNHREMNSLFIVSYFRHCFVSTLDMAETNEFIALET